jgi:hypothetical protein
MCAMHMFRLTGTIPFFRMSVCLRVLAGLLTLLSLAPLQAQNNGTLTGSVVDQTGAAVPNAPVELLLPGGVSAILRTTTGADGSFSISTVKPGT